MAHDYLQTQEEIYRSLRDSLSGRIAKLTNFTDRSFNYVWTQAFSEEVRELQELALVSELAGFIDYTGGPITDDDLEDLNLADDITAERVNELMQDEYLDEFIKIVGVSRNPGSKATGTVKFITQSAQTNIPAGTRVTTDTDETGSTTDFVTTESASTDSGQTEVDNVPIEAIDEGDNYNIPANEIVRVSNPPVGVTGVTNNAATTGGEDEETNDELRERAKSAVGGASEGGTVEGIKAYIRNNIDAVQQEDIIIDEFTDDKPPTVDVIVDGGLETDVKAAIEFSRPTGIRHNLVRPEIVQIGADVDLHGTDIDTVEVENTVEEFLLELGIGDNFYSDQIIREIMLSDDDILNIDLLDTFIERVTNETFTYDSTQTDYRLDYTYEDENGSITIVDNSGTTYTEGDDFTVDDQTGDGYPETIVWGGGLTPEDGVKFFVDYDVTIDGETKTKDIYNGNLVRDEIFNFNLDQEDSFDYNNSKKLYSLNFIPFDDSITVTDENTTTFTQGVDYQLAPLQDFAKEDIFTFDDIENEYALSEDYDFGDNAVIDADGIIYEEGVDYQMIDSDNDGFDDTIDWSLTGATPSNGVEFTVNYNAYNDHIRWDQNETTPPQDDQFTATYDQVLYETELEITETPGGIIRDADGTVYDEDTEYILVDNNRETEQDGIYWTENPSTLDDSEEFYFSYLTEGDIIFGDREKADPGTIDVQVN